jgi:Big-like domain-containing protein
MIKTTMAVSFLLAASNLSHAASNCEIPPFKLIPDVTVTAVMYVTPGKRCTIGVLNSAGGALSHEITRRPSNGKVEINGLDIRYTPRAGFVGADSFSYVRHSRDFSNNRPITLPVNMNIIVAAY